MRIPALDTAAVGAPITRLGVSFFPVYLPGNEPPDIATGDASGLEVAEMRQEEVNLLRAANPTRTPILLVEGEHLLGGKQNRVINQTVLIPPGASVEVPVTCVQAERWGYETDPGSGTRSEADRSEGGEFRRRRLHRSAAMAPPRLRLLVGQSVRQSLQSGRGHKVDQSAAWNEVRTMMEDHRAPSASAAAAETEQAVFDRDRERSYALRSLTERGPLPLQNGIAVAHRSRVVAIDLFGAPALLAEHWARLVRSHLWDLPSAGHLRESPPPSVTRVLRGVRCFPWMEPLEKRGLGGGTEFHAQNNTLTGHLLALDEHLIHAAFQFTGTGTDEDGADDEPTTRGGRSDGRRDRRDRTNSRDGLPTRGGRSGRRGL